jgi:hypothetical protein
MDAAYSAAFDIFVCIYQKQPQDNASKSSPGSTTSAMTLTRRASSHAPGLGRPSLQAGDEARVIYRNGIGGRGALSSPCCGGSWAGAGAGVGGM